MEGFGFVNDAEVDWIAKACATLDRELMDMNSRSVTVSILCFYRAQALAIRRELGLHTGRRYAKLHFNVIDAIDKIQGQESDVVFLSFCRTAGKRVGPRFGQWLQDLRRLNVACTRAHRALIFVGQCDMLKKLCYSEDAMGFYQHLFCLFDECPDTMTIIKQFGDRRSG